MTMNTETRRAWFFNGRHSKAADIGSRLKWTIFSTRKTNVARPAPMPKIKNVPIRSFNLMGTCNRVVWVFRRDFVLAKHSCRGNPLLAQNWSCPLSHSDIKLYTYIPRKVRTRQKRTQIILDIRAVQTRSELVVFLQNNGPESVLKWQRIGDVKTAGAFLFQLIHDEVFAKWLNLKEGHHDGRVIKFQIAKSLLVYTLGKAKRPVTKRALIFAWSVNNRSGYLRAWSPRVLRVPDFASWQIKSMFENNDAANTAKRKTLPKSAFQ